MSSSKSSGTLARLQRRHLPRSSYSPTVSRNCSTSGGKVFDYLHETAFAA